MGVISAGYFCMKQFINNIRKQQGYNSGSDIFNILYIYARFKRGGKNTLFPYQPCRPLLKGVILECIVKLACTLLTRMKAEYATAQKRMTYK